MEHQLFEVTQAAIIKNSENKVLILQHQTGKWLLVGGRINKGEYWLDALKREVQEETGINDFKIISILEVNSVISDDKAKYSVTFICEAQNMDHIQLSDEHRDFAWVNSSNINDYEFWHESIKQRIEKALRAALE